MPHQCTNCSRTFSDGSKDMLGGCPDCGGNKFQFLPPSAVDDEPSAEGAPTATQTQTTLDESAARAETAPPEDDIIEAPTDPIPASGADSEDRAQASARRALVSEDELPAATPGTGSNDPDAVPDEEDRPDLAQLREELNDQFESIKILRPGEYELNLMELYDREEYIIALEEDGRYVIDVPDSWRDEQ
jgi:predicted  nucleic acid-binding Zn-ribbon protein